MKTLWISSFTKELYDVSGKDLIDSFNRHQRSDTDRLYVGIEGDINIPEGFPISHLKSLTKWLETNKDIIPQYLGGDAEPCKCKNPYSKKERDHKKNCHFIWWNRNCSRWYRKAVCLQVTYEHSNLPDLYDKRSYDLICWIDSDCVFKKRLNTDLFKDRSCAYLKGPRPVLEAGFVAYNLEFGGQYIIQDFYNYYQRKYFRQFSRWDDCYILQKVLRSRNEEIQKTYLDLASRNKKDLGKHSDVFTNSRIGNAIQHNKGKHGRELGIMI